MNTSKVMTTASLNMSTGNHSVLMTIGAHCHNAAPTHHHQHTHSLLYCTRGEQASLQLLYHQDSPNKHMSSFFPHVLGAAHPPPGPASHPPHLLHQLCESHSDAVHLTTLNILISQLIISTTRLRIHTDKADRYSKRFAGSIIISQLNTSTTRLRAQAASEADKCEQEGKRGRVAPGTVSEQAILLARLFQVTRPSCNYFLLQGVQQ